MDRYRHRCPAPACDQRPTCSPWGPSRHGSILHSVECRIHGNGLASTSYSQRPNGHACNPRCRQGWHSESAREKATREDRMGPSERKARV
jgi:hypothetical protein